MDYPDIPGTLLLNSSPTKPPSAADPLPKTLTNPAPPSPTSKNIFAYWHTGLHTLPPYLLRNVLAWHTRFSPLGWTIYIIDTVPDSPLNISNYINTTSPSVVPAAFRDGKLDGGYIAQHTSDLVRYPLLLKYGGLYLDVGILLFGDIDWLWTEKLANPKSPYEFAGFTLGSFPAISFVNFALMSTRDNPLVRRAHQILLKLWDVKTNTTGMHEHELVNHVPLMRVPKEIVVTDEGAGKMEINDEAMTDYAIQIQCMGAAQRWVDEEGGWDGPAYVREKCWAYSMMDHAYSHEQLAGWNANRLHELFSLEIPTPGQPESEDQKLARKIVETLVRESWCLKLAHGFSAKLFGGDTLGMLWRKHQGSDCTEGTYAGWLRWVEVNLKQEKPLAPREIPAYEPTMKGKPLM